MSLLVIALLTVLATGLIAVAYREARIGANEQTYVQALFNADAGTEEAKMRLSPTAPAAAHITPVLNTAWRAYILSGSTQAQIQGGLDPMYGLAPPNYTTNESTANYSYYPTVQTGSGAISWGWARIQYKVNGTGQILYLDAVTGAETTAGTQTVNGQPVNNFPIFLVTVRGVAGYTLQGQQAQRQVRLELQPIVATTTTTTETTTTVVTDPFGQGAHGKNGVSLIGNAMTDSYDSRNGAYCASCPPNGTGNRDSQGNVGTDSTAAAAISLTGNSVVNGSAAVGPGGDPSSGISKTTNTNITGSTTPEPTAWNIPVSSVPGNVTCGGQLKVTGNGKNATKLSQGTYCFSSIAITGNGQLIASGPVKIYVTGNINIGGNGIVTANSPGTSVPAPPNMLIYGLGTSVSVSGNGNFYGAIYAPAADISVNGNATGNVYGALTGKTVTLNSGNLHWDKALQNLGATSQTIVTDTSTTTYSATGFRHWLWNEDLL